MARYRKKPVVIEAWQWDGGAGSDERPDWVRAVCFRRFGDQALVVPSLEGDMIASPGDWIIRGIKGEVYPCKPDIFAATYEPVGTE